MNEETIALDDIDAMRRNAWDKAHLCYGSYRVMELIVNDYKRKLRYAKYVGYLYPVLAVAVLAFNLHRTQAGMVIIGILVGILTIAQLIMLIAESVQNWQDKLMDARLSMDINKKYYNKYEVLAKGMCGNHDLKNQLTALNEQLEITESIGSSIAISEEMKRYGRRAVNYAYRLPCPVCKETPASLQPSSCQTCGSFKRRYAK